MHLRFISLFLISITSLAVLSQHTQDSLVSYYDKDHFLLEGILIPDSLKENYYDRLPYSLKDQVREPVWKLSRASAGLSISFITNSTSIQVKWTVLHDLQMNHMAETGIKGLDLYVLQDNSWRYLNTARPSGQSSEFLLISNMSHEFRKYRLYLPLYDGVVDLQVGIDPDSEIRKPEPVKAKPIVFYGTSITQGGCASRPGMVHTNILSRKLSRYCINFGFSGNGKMEQPIVELIAEIDPAFYVIECLPNMKPVEISERTIPLVHTIRIHHPSTPVLLVENFEYDAAILDHKLHANVQEKNQVLKREYKKIQGMKIPNVYYIDSMGAAGLDHEGTVDGIHFTDLGFIRYADFLMEKFKDIGLVDTNGHVID